MKWRIFLVICLSFALAIPQGYCQSSETKSDEKSGPFIVGCYAGLFYTIKKHYYGGGNYVDWSLEIENTFSYSVAFNYALMDNIQGSQENLLIANNQKTSKTGYGRNYLKAGEKKNLGSLLTSQEPIYLMTCVIRDVLFGNSRDEDPDLTVDTYKFGYADCGSFSNNPK
jgi:hypothetical protein